MRAVEKRLRERIKELEAELQEVKIDREAHRRNLIRNFKTAIEIHGKGHYWNMLKMIEQFSKDIAQTQWWYW